MSFLTFHRPIDSICCALFIIFTFKCGCADYYNYDNNKLCDLGCGCLLSEQNQIFLDCGRKGIEELPLQIEFNINISSVTFQENSIKYIRQDTFLRASNIEDLDLSKNSLLEISENSFKPFQSLIHLRLSHNNISVLHNGLLSGLQNLRILELSNNHLTDIQSEAFESTNQLMEIRLHSNKIRSISENAFMHLPHLEKLDLERNDLKHLPEDIFATNSRLQWLSLADNKLDHIPKDALSRPKLLSSLDVSGNKLSIIKSESFSSLSNINLLYLNNLDSLSRIEKNAFVGMTKLKTLSLSYNRQLSYVDPEAFGRPRLRQANITSAPSEKLYLRNNGFKSLPEPREVTFWSSVPYIDLSENPWKCDCKIRWMIKLRPEIKNNARCESPFGVHGRTIGSLAASDLVCNDHWAYSMIVLVLTSIVAFFVCAGFALTVLCYKTRVGTYVRSKAQFTYSQVNPRKERYDLEWDPTADL